MTCSDSSLHQVVFLDAGTLPSGLPFAPAQRALIDYRAHDTTAPSEVAERVADACIVIVNKVKLGEAEMAAAPSLRRICVSAAGTDNIDLQAAAARQISVFNVPDYGSEAVAEAYLAQDLVTALQATLRHCPILAAEPEGRLAAIVDFTFNLGAGRLQTSTLRRRINQRDWLEAARELRRWVNGGGKVLPGLVTRRETEVALMLG